MKPKMPDKWKSLIQPKGKENYALGAMAESIDLANESVLNTCVRHFVR